MNLIETYKKAKDIGEAKIINSNCDVSYCVDNVSTFASMIEFLIMNTTLRDSVLLDDFWQIERKPMVWEGEVIWDAIGGFFKEFIYPSHGNVGTELQKFKGKRTKIRIEEIMEE